MGALRASGLTLILLAVAASAGSAPGGGFAFWVPEGAAFVLGLDPDGTLVAGALAEVTAQVARVPVDACTTAPATGATTCEGTQTHTGGTPGLALIGLALTAGQPGEASVSLVWDTHVTYTFTCAWSGETSTGPVASLPGYTAPAGGITGAVLLSGQCGPMGAPPTLGRAWSMRGAQSAGDVGALLHTTY